MNFNRLFVVSCGLLLSSVTCSVNASFIDLGAAKNYNAFIHKDFSATSSDVEGRMAAGGDVSISNYSVNIKHGSQLYADTSSSPALVVGGDLNFTSGQVAGDVFVGGNYTPTASGTVTNGTVQSGGIAPINFDDEFDALIDLAVELALLPENSTATDLWSTQHLVGAGSNGVANDLHVFNLDASDMLFSDYLLSEVDKGDTVLFNVAGTDIATSWGNFAGSDNSLFDFSENILFNFFEAETLTINAAMYGSILAPKASIEAPHGVIWGQVIAESWHGNTQINDNPFVSKKPNAGVTVPEPATLAIFALGIMGLLVRKSKK